MNNLKLLRVEKHLTMRELADKVGICYTTISSLENEKRPFNLDHLTRLSKFFDCSFDYLLGKTNNRNENVTNVDIAFYDQHGIVSEEQKKEIENFIAFIKSRDNK
jgi:transcriptional regulator with XRE-family HTH domain